MPRMLKNADDDDAQITPTEMQTAGKWCQEGSGRRKTLPSFVKGESGDHQPTLTEKWTTPPKYYTEATLLRAMETAG